jgi:hypothetical protein
LQLQAQGLISTPFFDGAMHADLQNAQLGQPVVDSQGQLIVPTFYVSSSCGNFSGYCGMGLIAIKPDGTRSWKAPTNLPASFIASDLSARKTVVIGLSDQVFVHGDRTTLYSFIARTGQAVLGWPVTIDPPGSCGAQFVDDALIDNQGGRIYVRSYDTVQCFPGVTNTIAAISPNGAVQWRNDYLGWGGSPPVQGPARDIYFLNSQKFQGVFNGTGKSICETAGTVSANGIVGSLEGVFTVLQGTVVMRPADAGLVVQNAPGSNHTHGFHG